MNFSINKNIGLDYRSQYIDFLTKEVYHQTNLIWGYSDVNDPIFLNKLGVLRAAKIQEVIENNGEILNGGFSQLTGDLREYNDTLNNKLEEAASLITNSLDKGFINLHKNMDDLKQNSINASKSLGEIKDNIKILTSDVSEMSRNIHVLNDTNFRGFTQLHNDLRENNVHLNKISNNLLSLSNMVGQGYNKLYTQIYNSNTLIANLLSELRIPESQRERRYHIEQGSKYLAAALKENDKYYFEDAIEEFNKTLEIERKDFNSWYNLGFIYLYSPQFLNLEKSADCFKRFLHYAIVESDRDLNIQIDNAYLYLAEIKYLEDNIEEALPYVENCKVLKTKAQIIKSKYLSTSSNVYKNREAGQIICTLLKTNPYLSLQILEDKDLLNNKYIIEILKQLRDEAVTKSKTLFLNIKKEFKNNDSLTEEVSYDLNRINELIDKSTYIEASEANKLLTEFSKAHRVRRDSQFDEILNQILNANSREVIIKSEYAINMAAGDKDKIISIVNKLFKAASNFDIEIHDKCMKKIIGYCNLILDKEPNNVQAFLNMGNCYESLEQYKLALKCYDRAIQLNSFNVEPYIAKVECLFYNNHLRKAKELCKDTLNLFPKNEEILELLQLIEEELIN